MHCMTYSKFWSKSVRTTCFAGCVARVLIVTSVKMPWSVQHLVWCVLDYSKVAAADESGRSEYHVKVGARVKNAQIF